MWSCFFHQCAHWLQKPFPAHMSPGTMEADVGNDEWAAEKTACGFFDAYLIRARYATGDLPVRRLKFLEKWATSA